MIYVSDDILRRSLYKNIEFSELLRTCIGETNITVGLYFDSMTQEIRMASTNLVSFKPRFK